MIWNVPEGNKQSQFIDRRVVFFLSLVMVLGSNSFLWAGDCPQPRFTEKAPQDIYNRVNPLPPTMENILAGKLLYEEKAKPMACKLCHGIKGDGRGGMSMGVHPQPRNFTCEKTINNVPDGQLSWIIRTGSPDTGMPAYEDLEDEEIWQLILYIRKLAQFEITEIRPGILSKDILGMR